MMANNSGLLDGLAPFAQGAVQIEGLRPGNVTVGGTRTSVRLEPTIWDALREIAAQERMSIHALCTMVNRRRGNSSLTSAIRVFVIAYYRNQCLSQLKTPVSS